MTAVVEQLKVQLSGLSEPERAELAHFLITSLEPDDGEKPASVEAAWCAEVQRRFEEMQSGQVVGIPADEVFVELAEAISMIPVVFHAEALAELREAATRYETQRAGLGADFRAEVEAAVARIQRNPQAFPVIDAQGTRRCLVTRFPYAIFFREVEGVVWIGAVAHQRRRPGYWLSRTPED